MSDERRSPVSVVEQLKQLALRTEVNETKKTAAAAELTVSVDADLPEADIVSQSIAACLSDEKSFITRKNSQRAPEFSGNEDERWAREIAWQLYPDVNMRAAGLPVAVQRSREQLVVEALSKNQPLELDFGILWIGEVSTQLTLTEYAIAQNIKGIIEILKHYHQLDPDLKAHLQLTVAVEPCLLNKVSHQVLEHYSQQLQQLILGLSHLSEPEAGSLTLEIICVEQVKTEPGHEQEQQQLTEQIREFWTESQVVYDEVLATKRIETGDETLTWERYTRSTWEFLKKVRGSDVDKDYQVYTRDYINGLGKNRLAKLASFQALPPEVSSLLGWLTPNYKLALLKQLCALQQIDVGAQTDEALLEDETLITQAAASLAHKILLNRAQQPPAARLGFEFGADLPDTPQNDRVKLKHWGNLSFTKISPWEQPLVMCRTQSQTPTQIKTGETERSEHSTPELHGLALKPAPENVVAITTTAELAFQDHQIDIPVRYLPASWLIETIKVCMEGNRD